LGSTVTIVAADGHALPAYVRAPARPPRAGIVVLQEIFGLNAHIRSLADAFASRDFYAVAPPLFDRVERGVELDYETVEPGRALVARLDPAQTMLDIAAAVTHATTAGKVFVAGYCWGGALAYLAACRLPVAAAACYYGRLIVDHLDEAPRCPVVYHYGDRDPHISADDIARVRTARPEGIFHVYAGAGHGFSCDARGDYRPEAAALALRRTLALFDAVL
jgi:carboxymethylenebutenolidase